LVKVVGAKLSPDNQLVISIGATGIEILQRQECGAYFHPPQGGAALVEDAQVWLVRQGLLNPGDPLGPIKFDGESKDEAFQGKACCGFRQPLPKLGKGHLAKLQQQLMNPGLGGDIAI
jgi:hypothetical protein